MKGSLLKTNNFDQEQSQKQYIKMSNKLDQRIKLETKVNK